MLDFDIKKLFSNKAYSIVEVAVSLVIIGVFLTSTLALFNSALNLAQKIEQQNFAVQTLQAVVSQVQNSKSFQTNVSNSAALLANGAYFFPLTNNNASSTYNLSSLEIKFDKDNSNCLEDPNAQVKFDQAGAQKPQYPICAQVFFKQVNNSKNIYCYAVRVTTQLSPDEYFSQTANGITNAQIFSGISEVPEVNVGDKFGCN